MAIRLTARPGQEQVIQLQDFAALSYKGFANIFTVSLQVSSAAHWERRTLGVWFLHCCVYHCTAACAVVFKLFVYLCFKPDPTRQYNTCKDEVFNAAAIHDDAMLQ